MELEQAPNMEGMTMKVAQAQEIRQRAEAVGAQRITEHTYHTRTIDKQVVTDPQLKPVGLHGTPLTTG